MKITSSILSSQDHMSTNKAGNLICEESKLLITWHMRGLIPAGTLAHPTNICVDTIYFFNK